VLLAACNLAPDARPSVVERHTPTITAVATSDGFTQICDGCTAVVVITGDGLSGITDILLASPLSFDIIVPTIVHRSDHVLRVRVEVPHGSSFDPLDLTISGRHGQATFPSAIEITPVVISPEATAGGHGTYQSPLPLCDPQVEQTANDDFLFLLAGTHTCDHVLHLAPGVTLIGLGAGVTRVVGTGAGVGFEFDGSMGEPRFAQLAGFTIEGEVHQPSIDVRSSNLAVSGVTDRGGTRVAGGSSVQIADYHFDGPGHAIDLEVFGDVRIADTTIRNAATGITVDVVRGPQPTGAFLELAAITIEHCGLGLQLGTLPRAPAVEQRLASFAQGVHLLDNALGVLVQDGDSILFESEIRNDAAAPSPISAGIRIENGSLSVVDSQIVGHTGIGFDVDTAATGGHGTSGVVNGVIAGGEVGVRARGFDRGTVVTLRSTIVRDQTVASVQLDGAGTLLDVGERGPSGPNAFSVVTGFAIDDQRTAVTPVTGLSLVQGVSLNGHPHTGELLRGPLALGADIRIISPDALWQF